MRIFDDGFRLKKSALLLYVSNLHADLLALFPGIRAPATCRRICRPFRLRLLIAVPRQELLRVICIAAAFAVLLERETAPNVTKTQRKRSATVERTDERIPLAPNARRRTRPHAQCFLHTVIVCFYPS
jgi:hypothetical protein